MPKFGMRKNSERQPFKTGIKETRNAEKVSTQHL